MSAETPYRNFNFLVDFGAGEFGFSEVSLPGASIEVVEYREGSDKRSSTRKLPGRTKVGNVVLRRGIGPDLTLWEWFKAVRDGNLERRDVVITLLDESRQPVRRWKLSNAWPAAYEGPTLNAEGSDVAIESVELTCEGLEIDT